MNATISVLTNGRTRKETDALELIFRFFIAVAVISTVAARPLATYMLQDPGLRIYKHALYILELVIPVPGMRQVWIIFISFGGCGMSGICWTQLLLSEFMMLFYVDSQCNWMTMIRANW